MIENEKKLSARKLQILALLAAGVMALLMIPCGSGYQYWAESYLIVPCALFLGVTFAAPLNRNAKKALILGSIMVAWILLALNIRGIPMKKLENAGICWSAYLLAFPFAAALQDSKTDEGLDLMGAMLIVASAVWAVWDGVHLGSSGDPNTAGIVYLMGIALSTRAVFRCHKPWSKAGLALLTLVQFFALTLTRERASILMACLFFGGIVFFYNLKKSWVKSAAYLLAGIILAGSLIAVSQAIYSCSDDVVSADQSAEITEISSGSTPLEKIPSNDYDEQVELPEKNGVLGDRISIWKAVLTTLRYHGDIRLRGTVDIQNAIEVGGHEYAENAYNSWLQMALSFGVPGLLIALYFTWIAVRDAVLLLFFRDCGIERKCIVLLVLCLLAAGMLEPILFAGESKCQYFNIMLFLCLGYMEQWRDDLNTCQK